MGLMADQNFWPLGKLGCHVRSPLQKNSYQPSPIFHKWLPSCLWSRLTTSELGRSTSWPTYNVFAYLDASLGELQQAALAFFWGMETSLRNIAKGACLICIWNAINKPWCWSEAWLVKVWREALGAFLASSPKTRFLSNSVPQPPTTKKSTTVFQRTQLSEWWIRKTHLGPPKRKDPMAYLWRPERWLDWRVDGGERGRWIVIPRSSSEGGVSTLERGEKIKYTELGSGWLKFKIAKWVTLFCVLSKLCPEICSSWSKH